MRRAQAEIIGLVLIVLLIAVGFLLYVRYALRGDGPKESYETTQQAQTFVNSLAKSELECGDSTYAVDELLKRIGAGSWVPNCDAEVVLNKYVAGVLDKTFDVWGTNYRFVYWRPGSPGNMLDATRLPSRTNEGIPEKQRCGARMNAKPAIYTVQLYPSPGSVEMRFYVCDE